MKAAKATKAAKFCRWIFILGMISCLAVHLCACSPSEPEQPTPPLEDPSMGQEKTVHLIQDGEAQFIIVRAAESEKVLSSGAAMLNTALSKLGNLRNFGIVTDDTEATEHEILIGRTNRPESDEVFSRLGEDLYRAEWVNGKFVIVGANDTATARGVRYLIREVLGYYGGEVTPSETIGLPETLSYIGQKSENLATDPRNAENVIVYTCDVLDYGAIGDGIVDDTAAFQAAIDAAYRLGGGTVYIPAGQYAIHGTLTVKRSVYLLGEWYNPETQADRIKQGTVLLAYGNKGKESADAMITIGASAGVIGLTVYYPEQDIQTPSAYPAAFLIRDALAGDGTQHASSIQNVTVVNGWRGIAADQGNQLPMIRDVYMSVLDYGFRINRCYDCARVITMHISPAFWASYEGISEDTVAAQTKKTAKGVILMRTDGQMMNDLSVRSCRVGLSLERNTEDGGETAGYTNLSHVDLLDCTIGIQYAYNSAAISMATIRCSDADAVCLQMTDSTVQTGELRLYDCDFQYADGSAIVVEAGAKALLAVQNSTFSSKSHAFAVDADGGVLLLTNNDFTGCEKAVLVGQDVLSAIVSNNKYDGEITDRSDDGASLVQTSTVKQLPETIDFTQQIGAAPLVAGSTQVFNVQDYGAKGDGKTDDSDAFASALAAAKRAGGGIVYVPAGYYHVKTGFTIPSGVELRGIHEGMHVTTGEGSVIYVTEYRGEEDQIEFIAMEDGSGLRGITFWYPEQNWKEIAAYPWTVSVLGQDCVIQNVCFGNAYRAINMADADCGGHFVDCVTGCVLRQGIALDGSSKAGVIMNTHFNATFYYAVYGTNLTDGSGAFGSSDMASTLFANHNANLTAYSFGETVDENLLFLFNYRARYGMEFTGGFDGTIVGSGVDGSLCGIRIVGSYDQPLTLLNFMDDIVPGETDEGNLAIYVDVDESSTVHFVAGSASSYNYVPSGLVVLKNGTLILDGFNAKVTPDSGKGAIRVEHGYAQLSGILFNHVGRLDADGAFTRQTDSAGTYDIYVAADGEADVYSAIGRYFFRDRLDGNIGSYDYVVTK